MRRSARNQSLPEDEALFLQSLTGMQLRSRCQHLYQAGWTLSAIGSPINRPRSTVRVWVTETPNSPAIRPIPTPINKEYVHKKPPSPGIPEDIQSRIAQLAPIARSYRSTYTPSHPATKANKELTDICRQYNELGVPIQELANLAGVTYRAMYRRIKLTP